MNSNSDKSRLIGITSTIPMEVVFAAGLIPVDINNIFIEDKDPEGLVTQAESDGFSNNICAWIKGIYSSVLNSDIKKVVAVTGGDCSNTIALSEIMALKGIEVVPFDFPQVQKKEFVEEKLKEFSNRLGAPWDEVIKVKKRLDKIREKLRELDRLTYIDNIVTGFENHIFLVSSSDFKSDPDKFENEIDTFLSEVKERKKIQSDIRLGVLGVPPILSGFFPYLESIGARVVFNEVQRQFSMPYSTDGIVEQYTRYTYPYGSDARIRDIKEAIEERKLDGLIHYTQTFCFRQLYDIVLRENLDIPMLTIEGDRPGEVDRRTALRIDAFIEMLKGA